MRVFRRVVERGSFSGAARELGMSNASASKAVAALEDRLGVRLLNRTTRRLSLTEVGRAYFDRAARILDDVDEAELAVNALGTAPRGTIRLSAPMSFGVMHLAPAIAGFLRRYPELGVDLSLNDRVVDVVEEGFDLAIRVSELADTSLIARRLAPARIAICATPGYLSEHGTPRTPADLNGHNCLIYAYAPDADVWRFTDAAGAAETIRVTGTVRVNNGEVIRRLLLDGIGIGRLPTFIVGEDLRAGRLRPVLADQVAQGSAVHAIYPHARHLSPKVRAFVDYLVDHFGPEPYWDAK